MQRVNWLIDAVSWHRSMDGSCVCRGFRLSCFSSSVGLAEVTSLLRTAYQSAPVQELTQGHWYQEVVQLTDEFPAVTYVKDEGKLRVELPRLSPWLTSNSVLLPSSSRKMVKSQH